MRRFWNYRSQSFALCTAGLLLAGSVALVGNGCQRAAAAKLSETDRATIQLRVTNHFPHAVMFKPVQGGFESALPAQLAPLLLQAVTTTNTAALWRDRPTASAAAVTLSAHTNTITIATNRYLQFSYVWSYPDTESSAPAALPNQGVRITLDSRGAPVIWEILADTTGADVIYVAQSIELLAQAEFGAPLPGRKYAVERGVMDAPRTVVANVIDDGPVPMGPILYLANGSRDVAALICRCMPSQVGTLAEQQDYQLDDTPANAQFAKPPLEERLRLPRRF